MTLEKAMIKLDMMDIFKMKCRPAAHTEDVLEWLKTFPKLRELVSHWPNKEMIRQIRKKHGCPMDHGGGAYRTSKKHHQFTPTKKPKKPAAAFTVGSGSARAPRYVDRDGQSSQFYPDND